MGMNVTIFNPKLDQSGKVARAFTDMLVASLSLGIESLQVPLAPPNP
jgi:hypothetical protein